ncbi:carboxylating nicotinate-nucleotide diphosphorylase [Corynebacterium anserum]|uniref:Nicotinate-nucleotide pyrophosphorylase [carboxylating] n=1 Tax=Corynebacterium anserum TaxID=2684406 RepID=A0A7G7YN18_9CORY|nr:carboxylating nicotinate-nucleotide diphosphorylase [Corynebacterium anserum]QNH95888.1 carboxylating nicotinate-nucleotide diphosphorylase [Corynebacterium anserum]
MVTSYPFPIPEALTNPRLIRQHFARMARAGLEEDLGYGPDLTTLSTISQGEIGRRVVRSRDAGVLSGLDAVTVLLEVASEPEWNLEGRVEFRPCLNNGDRVDPGTAVAVLEGDLRVMLQVERTILNILSHACGIATHTAQWVAQMPEGVAVRDSRKTLPGLRMLQKRAVIHGGGTPHRWALGDQVMVKDNHVGSSEGGVLAAYELVKDVPHWVEIEVDTLEQLRQLLQQKPTQILLDNFTVKDTCTAVDMRDELSPETLLESSGGITYDSAAMYGATGVDSIAVGALTHSVRVLDLGLD